MSLYASHCAVVSTVFDLYVTYNIRILHSFFRFRSLLFHNSVKLFIILRSLRHSAGVVYSVVLRLVYYSAF